MLTPDSLDGMVRIPVSIRNGTVELRGGGALPRLRDGEDASLFVPRGAVISSDIESHLTQDSEVELVPAKVELLAHVVHESNDPRVRRLDIASPFETTSPGYVSIILQEPLWLRFRGSRSPTLKPCRCWIPALGQERASLNEAYTRISEEFEPRRRSHTGNVFKKVFICRTGVPTDWKDWAPLESKRDQELAAFVERHGAILRELIAAERESESMRRPGPEAAQS
jgi:hypothetical protein